MRSTNSRPALGLLLALGVALGVVLTACGSPPSGPGAAAAPGAPPSSVAAPGAAAEVNPSGDIPDNQAFVPFIPPDGSFTVSVPEGWARTSQGRRDGLLRHPQHDSRRRAARAPQRRPRTPRATIVDRAGAAPSRLSGGEAARAGLAVALANDPAVVPADEPTGELDSDTETTVLDLVRGIADRGAAVLVASHSAVAAVERRAERSPRPAPRRPGHAHRAA